MDNDQLLSEIKALLEGVEFRLREYVYDTETKLMRAFAQWQVSSEARMKTVEVNLIPLMERQSAIEALQAEMERRLNAIEHPPRQVKALSTLGWRDRQIGISSES